MAKSDRIMPRDRTCRGCGCTEDDACVRDGATCTWVEIDLCSFCVPGAQQQLTSCKRCADPIGEGQEKNAVYMCDVVSGEWCGSCFDTTPCGRGRHGEGCSTLMICAAAASTASSARV